MKTHAWSNSLIVDDQDEKGRAEGEDTWRSTTMNDDRRRTLAAV